MSHRFDATLKDIVAERPGDFAGVFDLPDLLPAVAINVDLSTISAATDVAIGYGQPVQMIVDLNFQTGPDAGLVERVHAYNGLINSRYRVPVETIIVLLRQKADASRLTGELAYGRPGRRLQFEYGVVRLWQEPVDDFLQAGIAALPLATLCRMPDGQPLPDALKEVVQEISRRLDNEAGHADAARLMTAAYILTGLRVPKEDLTLIYRGVGLMKESTAFDDAIDEGQIKGQISLLLRQGRKRFGNPDATTEAALTSIKHIERLERLGDAILTANSWHELLMTW